MPLNKNNQKQFKEKLKRLHSKIKEDILTLDKEIAEMKKTESKNSRDDEKRFASLADNINFAEESLYESIISKVELDAIVALAEHGFDLVDFAQTKKKEAFPLILKKDGVNINLEVSSPTKLLLEELTAE
jgi:hypothetical protein